MQQHPHVEAGGLVDRDDDGDANANDASNEIHELVVVVVVEEAVHQRHQLLQLHACLTNCSRCYLEDAFQQLQHLPKQLA